ncbi:MAG: hypothetical protein WBP63_13395, partial [Silvibacterium sp.]
VEKVRNWKIVLIVRHDNLRAWRFSSNHLQYRRFDIYRVFPSHTWRRKASRTVAGAGRSAETAPYSNDTENFLPHAVHW